MTSQGLVRGNLTNGPLFQSDATAGDFKPSLQVHKLGRRQNGLVTASFFQHLTTGLARSFQDTLITKGGPIALLHRNNLSRRFQGGQTHIEIYRALGVRELWFWRRGAITVHVLRDGTYEEVAASEVLVGLDLAELVSFLDRPTTSAAIRDYRAKLEPTPPR